MKYIWEEKDIRVGRRVKWGGRIEMIGYIPFVKNLPDHDPNNCFCLVDIEEDRDGLVSGPYTRKKLVSILNDQPYIPVNVEE